MSNGRLITEAREWTMAVSTYPGAGYFIQRLATALEAANAECDAARAAASTAKHDALHGFAADLMTYCLEYSTPDRMLAQVVGLAKRNGDIT